MRFVQPRPNLRALEALKSRGDLRRHGQEALADRHELRGDVLAVGVDRDQLAPLLRQLELLDVRCRPPLSGLLELEVTGPVGGLGRLLFQALREPPKARDERIRAVAVAGHSRRGVEMHLSRSAVEFSRHATDTDQEIRILCDHGSK